jgi:hypothetical protein
MFNFFLYPVELTLFIIAPWGNSEWATDEHLKTHLPGVYCSKDDEHFAVQLTFDDMFVDK